MDMSTYYGHIKEPKFGWFVAWLCHFKLSRWVNPPGTQSHFIHLEIWIAAVIPISRWIKTSRFCKILEYDISNESWELHNCQELHHFWINAFYSKYAMCCLNARLFFCWFTVCSTGPILILYLIKVSCLPRQIHLVNAVLHLLKLCGITPCHVS